MAGITTPFTTPTFPFLQTVSQRALDTHLAGLRAPERSDRRADRAHADRRPRPGRVRRRRHARLRLRAAVERVGAAGADDEHRRRGRLRRVEHHARRHPRHQPQSADGRSARAGDRRCSQRVPNPFFGTIPRSSSLGDPTITRRAAPEAVPAYTTVSLYRNNVGTTRYQGLEAESPAAVRARAVVLGRLHPIEADRRCLVGVRRVDPDRTGRELPGGRQLQSARSSATTRPATSRTSSSRRWCGTCRRAPAAPGSCTACSARSPTTGRSPSIVTLQSGVPVAVTQTTNFNAFAGFGVQRPNLVGDPTLAGRRADARALVQHGGLCGRAAVHARLGVAQPGPRPFVPQRRPRADATGPGRVGCCRSNSAPKCSTC